MPGVVRASQAVWAEDRVRAPNRDHARDGEVIIAYAMNGEQLPLLNGFPLRLVVPGWYATYWVKMLNGIEVLDKPDDNFWTAKAYLIPDTPHANILLTMVQRAYVLESGRVIIHGSSPELANNKQVQAAYLGV